MQGQKRGDQSSFNYSSCPLLGKQWILSEIRGRRVSILVVSSSTNQEHYLFNLLMFSSKVFQLFLQFTALHQEQEYLLQRKGQIQIIWESKPKVGKETWCMLRMISDPPTNSPLTNIWGNVGQWLQRVEDTSISILF